MLENWTPRERPSLPVLDGQYCRLERLSAALHAKDLFETCGTDEEVARAIYLLGTEKLSSKKYMDLIAGYAANPDLIFYAVIDKRTQKACGRQAFMRMDVQNGVLELGMVHWSSLIARSRITTEAFYLAAEYALGTLGYRRLEWKCDTRNTPSMRAADRFGMSYEGIFRQHMVRNGSRDTAWYSMLDYEWQTAKIGFENWLVASNFEENGQQRQKLQHCLAQSKRDAI